MVKKIEKLTPEQEAKMSGWAEKWTKIGLQTGDADFKTFEKYMPICYEKAGLIYPKNIVRVQSPIVGAFAASISNNIWKKSGAVGGAVEGVVGGAVRGAVDEAVDEAVRGAVDEAVDEDVNEAVYEAVGEAVNEAVDEAVRGAVGGAVDETVRETVREAVYGAVREDVGTAVYGAVSEAVYEAVRGAVREDVGTAVYEAVRGAVREDVGTAVYEAVSGAVDEAVHEAVDEAKISWHYWLGGQFWVGGWWYGSPSFVSFFTDVCGLELEQDILERATAYRKICESVNYIWPNRNFVIVCDRPEAINLNAQGRLHNEHGMSIRYKDGWGLYHLNGVKFDKKLYTKVILGMPFEEILKIEDIDQRTQAMKFAKSGIRDFYKQQNGKKIDNFVKLTKDGDPINYELWEIPAGEVFDRTVKFAIYDCPSSLVTNNKREYTKGVPVECKTVAEAMAWGMSDENNICTSKMWMEMIPLLDES